MSSEGFLLQVQKMRIERAKKNDAEKLTELTIRSKDYWNYGEKQILEWKDELAITTNYLEENRVYKLTTDKKIFGFYAFQSETKKRIKLDFLFIAPEFIGNGLGTALLTDFLKRIKKAGYKKITLDADPNAEKFYEKNGFKAVGKLKSSIENRFLPIMEFEITAN